jgi:Tol biopolymer transport system component
MLVVRHKNGSRVEEMGEGFDSLSDPVLNADGSSVAYAAGKGSRKYLVVDDQRRMKFSMIDRIVFDPAGKAVAFRAGQYGKQLVVAGEARSDELDEILSGPVWSKDGKKVAFTARIGSEIWSKVLDVK